MYILDAIIIVILIIGIMGGIRRGLIKSVVLLVGMIAILVVSFYLKNPVSAFFYKTLPFYSLGGVAPIFNIVLYEFIAFITIFSVLYLILRILLKLTGLIEKLLKATIILGFVSSIGGAVVGFVESYIVVFIFLFLFSQPFINVTGVEESVFAKIIINKTPLLSEATKDTRSIASELDELRIKNAWKTDEYNKKAVDLFLKYEIISKDNLNILIKKGKIDY
jgi:uncharacterized membrane protein required for colicin V production